MPASSAYSSVNSIGKPYVSYRRNASTPEITVVFSSFAFAITSAKIASPS